ncbi:Uroplakin-3B-Like Protein 1 [Manis pentadactyla]|nr:Uroplakin-3B-Like Protein 1 [Manis pentadactyla]
MLRVVSQRRTAEKDLIRIRASALTSPSPSRGSHWLIRVGRALHGAPTRATVKVNHPGPAPCPSPASRHLNQWRGAGNGRGSGGGKPSQSHYLRAVEPLHLCAGARGSEGGSSSGGRARASPSRPVTRHPGSAPPHPGSSLFPRRAPRSGAASSHVALLRFWAPPSARPGAPQVPSIRPAPNQVPFCLVSLEWNRRGAGGGGAHSPEPAQCGPPGSPASSGGGAHEAPGSQALRPSVKSVVLSALRPGPGVAARFERGLCWERCESAGAQAPPWGMELGSCQRFAALVGSDGSARASKRPGPMSLLWGRRLDGAATVRASEESGCEASPTGTEKSGLGAEAEPSKNSVLTVHRVHPKERGPAYSSDPTRGAAASTA